MADSLAALDAEIETFVHERDWAQFHTPKNLAMSVAIEAAEILEHFQWLTGEESHALPRDKRDQVANEIGDVLIYLMRLSRTLDIDIVAAARNKLEESRRKYPVEKAKGKATKYVDFD